MNNVYLIYGNDYTLIKKEIDKLVNNIDDVAKYDLSEVKIDYLLDDASCISLFGDKKALIGDNALFLTTSTNNIEHNLDYLSKYIDDDHENIVILIVNNDSLDNKKKIVKLINQKCTVIHKEKIDDKNINNFVINEFKNKGYKISIKDAKYFTDIVGKNVDVISSEIDKMVIYKNEDKEVSRSDIESISSKIINDNVFDLTDAIVKKDYEKIINNYNDLLKNGIDPVIIISLLGTQFTLIYQCKLLHNKNKSESTIASILDIHPYRVKLALESDFLEYEVKEILLKLHELDIEIKTGKIDKFSGLEMFLMSI